MQLSVLENSIANGTVLVGDKQYLHDAKGNLVPLENVKPADKLQDETVRKVIGYARDLSAQVARFKQHTLTICNPMKDCSPRNTAARLAARRETRPS